MSSIFGNLRQRLSIRNREFRSSVVSRNSESIAPSDEQRESTGNAPQHHSTTTSRQAEERHIEAVGAECRENERNRSEAANISRSPPIAISDQRPERTEVADPDANSTTVNIDISILASGTSCSSSGLSSIEGSPIRSDLPTPSHGELRTRVLQRSLTRTSAQADPLTANYSEKEWIDEQSNEEGNNPDRPLSFSLRDVVDKTGGQVTALCGKLLEIPKKKLKQKDSADPSACVQQGVQCEHGNACPFAIDIDGVSKELVERRLRSIREKVDKRAEDQLQVYATQKAEFFSDFDVICDACLQVKQCVEVPSVNRQEKLLICQDCMVPLLSGAWYHGMDTSDTVNVCSDLMEKAGLSSHDADGNVVVQLETPENEKPLKLVELAENAPSTAQHDSDEEYESACDALAAKRLATMSERHAACSPSLAIQSEDDITSPADSFTESQADEKRDDIASLDIPFPSRRRPSDATERLQLQLGSSPQATSALSSLDSFSEGEFSDGHSMSTCTFSEYSAADLAPGLEPMNTTGQEPVGEIELGLQIGLEASKQRSSFVLDVLRGYNFKLWENVGDKPGFEIYVKCYLIFPGRVVKMKTRHCAPGSQPEFLDQLISIMNKKLLSKAEHLKVQVWEDHGGMKKKQAVGVATIDLTKIRTEELVMGCYPLYMPRQHGSKPSTPNSPSAASLSPSNTSTSLTRTGSGRFVSLRNSFKRRDKLRQRNSSGSGVTSSPLLSRTSDLTMSTSAPTASSVLTSTPTHSYAEDQNDSGETDL